MRRHVVDGAEILRRTPEIPSIAPVVAFEHHLRSDGTGYPVGVSRPKLNLATMLCSIADVYDAMRSQRAYQGSLPTERILEVMKRADGHQFDQHLVRRFTQLLGIYPPGNLVLLDDGAIAVVLQVHAPDPHRPRVRVIMDSKRRRLVTPDRPQPVRRSARPGPRAPHRGSARPVRIRRRPAQLSLTLMTFERRMPGSRALLDSGAAASPRLAARHRAESRCAPPAGRSWSSTRCATTTSSAWRPHWTRGLKRHGHRRRGPRSQLLSLSPDRDLRRPRDHRHRQPSRPLTASS